MDQGDGHGRSQSSVPGRDGGLKRLRAGCCPLSLQRAVHTWQRFILLGRSISTAVGIEPTGAKRYAFHAIAHSANLTGTVNPVMVTLTIGDDSGTTPVKAKIQ